MTKTRSLRQADLAALHERIEQRMHAEGQRYTSGRRRLIDTLANADRPLDMSAIGAAVPEVPQSSAYRSLALFTSLNVVTRIIGNNDYCSFELSEAYGGSHHHHVVCKSCGRVCDINASPALEQALTNAAKSAAKQSGFQIDAHSIELIGVCKSCR